MKDEDLELLWRRERSEQVADCRVFKVRRDYSADPRGGRVHDFYVIEAPDWINVVPLTSRGEVVLIEQYRHGTRELSLEIPGGMVDEGESPAAAAARELTEETGYEAGELVFLGRTRTPPKCSCASACAAKTGRRSSVSRRRSRRSS